MINTVRDYENIYSYRAATHKRKTKQQNEYRRIMGSVLIMLSFFILFMLPDQDGNWTLTGLMVTVAIALFNQSGGITNE